MRRDSSYQKLKSVGAFIIILMLLPYIITVFVHGIDLEEVSVRDRRYVTVKITDKSGKEQIKEVPWEDYFIGVLAKDMPSSYHREALKAQAVLIRSSLYKQLLNAGEGQDRVVTEAYLTPEELEKKWGVSDFEKSYKKFLEAVEETENQVLYYGEAIAWTPFHQSSNGMIRSANEVIGNDTYPYLMTKECPKDKEAEEEMHIYIFEYSEVKAKCMSFLVAAEGEDDAGRGLTIEDFEIKANDSAGYVSELRIGNTICTGDQFRDALSLASGSFSIQDDHGKLKITTTGKGHGLGMSQWTANEMAKEGKNYGEILQFFFEGTNIMDGGEIFNKTE